jgi:hypothetical protein
LLNNRSSVFPSQGLHGAKFNAPNISYNAGEDPGWDSQASLVKTSSSVGRAASAAEWSISGGNSTASPGAENAGQVIVCDPIVLPASFAAYNDSAYEPGSDGGGVDPQGNSVHYYCGQRERRSRSGR